MPHVDGTLDPDIDPGHCPECSAGWEMVRPGKAQPTCDCQDKCLSCGLMRRHVAPGEIARNISGFCCPNCDSDEDMREALIVAGTIPANAKLPWHLRRDDEGI